MVFPARVEIMSATFCRVFVSSGKRQGEEILLRASSASLYQPSRYFLSLFVLFLKAEIESPSSTLGIISAVDKGQCPRMFLYHDIRPLSCTFRTSG